MNFDATWTHGMSRSPYQRPIVTSNGSIMNLGQTCSSKPRGCAKGPGVGGGDSSNDSSDIRRNGVDHGEMKQLTGALLITLALGACGSQAPAAPPANSTVTTTTTTTTPTPTPTTTTVHAGPVAFVEWAKTEATLGDRDPSLATEEVLLNVGNRACEVMATQPSFGQAVQTMTEELKADVGVTAAEMDVWFRQAVVNLCPQHKDLLP